MLDKVNRLLPYINFLSDATHKQDEKQLAEPNFSFSKTEFADNFPIFRLQPSTIVFDDSANSLTLNGTPGQTPPILLPFERPSDFAKPPFF